MRKRWCSTKVIWRRVYTFSAASDDDKSCSLVEYVVDDRSEASTDSEASWELGYDDNERSREGSVDEASGMEYFQRESSSIRL